VQRLGPGQVPVAKNGEEPTLLMMSLTKHLKPKTRNNFFIADSKTCQVFWGFVQFSSTISWGAMRLGSQPKYPWFFPDFQVQYIRRPAAKVLTRPV